MWKPRFAALLALATAHGACAEPPTPLDISLGTPPWVTLNPDRGAADTGGIPIDAASPDHITWPDTTPSPDTVPQPDTPNPPDTWYPPDTTDCPIAKIICDEGDEVIPQTVLHMDGTKSWSSFGGIAIWEWSVTQPPGSVSVLLPNHTSPEIKLEANVAGSYVFKLEVWDETGAESCSPATYEVKVIPDDGIHVELLWHTPGDPDETDQGWGQGSDVDLHLTHPVSDGWFDPVHDCHHYNKTPEWGSPDYQVDDDPRLDRDDIDGAGPENINIHSPQEVTYRVGVHSWSEHGYGNSIAEIRIYLWSILVLQWGGVEIGGHLMWDVCEIDFQNGDVKPLEDQFGGPKMSWIDPPPPP